MRFRFLLPLALSFAVFGQDHPAHTTGAGLNFYKLDREIALGAQLADAVRRETKMVDSDLVQDYVARLGRQLAMQTPGPKFQYTFTVIADLPASTRENPTYEPLALPGGAIFVPASLILAAQNTAELAGMIAHSIAHVADRDCTRSITRTDLMQVAAVAGTQSHGCWVGQATGQAVPLGYLAFQQAFERQSDYLAVQIMAKCGYDPAALAAYIGRVQQAPGRQTTSRVFSPWPPAQERVKLIEKQIQNLSPDQPYSAGEDIQPIQLELRNLRAK